jgi:hypothetical protein
LPSFTQQLDFSSTKTSKRRKTMEEEEILTLRAEREKYLQEAEFYKTKMSKNFTRFEKYSIGYKPYQFCKIDLCPL